MKKNLKKKSVSSTFFKGMRVLNFDSFHPRKGFIEQEKGIEGEYTAHIHTLNNTQENVGDYEILWI